MFLRNHTRSSHSLHEPGVKFRPLRLPSMRICTSVFHTHYSSSSPRQPGVNMTGSKSAAVSMMDEYKGSSFPSPIFPLLGFALGFGIPYALVNANVFPSAPTTPSSSSGSSPAIDAVLVTLQSFGYVSLFFAAEFVLGAAARSTSRRASFSPAAAAASGQNPFVVTQANRIHQNHIENFCVFGPSVLAAAASGGISVDWICATVWSWIGFRVAYRIGYCYAKNPFWRIFGVSGAMCQCMICWWFLWWHNGVGVGTSQ